MEERVWNKVVEFLESPDVFLAEAENHIGRTQLAAPQLEADIAQIEGRLVKLDLADQRAYTGYARGVTSEGIYRNVKSDLDAERSLLAEELGRRQDTLSDLQDLATDQNTVRELRSRVENRLVNATHEDKKFVLDCLDSEVLMGPTSALLTLAVPGSESSSVNTRP